MNDDERLVREIWTRLPHRSVVGHRLNARVGERGWARPRMAKFGAWFVRCGMPNPWDPDAKQVDVGLGDVGIAGEARRPVAPHLTPPPEKTAPRAPNLPARQPTQSDGPQLGATRRDDTADLRRRMEEKERAKAVAARPPQKYTVDKPLAKLPVRPGAEAASPARPAPPRVPPPSASSTNRIAVAPTRRAVLPDGPEELDDEPGNIFGTPIQRPPEERPPSMPVSPPTPPKPPHGGGGMDDFFGAGDNTRMRIPKKDEGGEARARRPMVSSAEDLARGGVDRRPPPPKALPVTPTKGRATDEGTEE